LLVVNVARMTITVISGQAIDTRLWYYRLSSGAIGWNPGVNVLLPDSYDDKTRYPVLYLLHGGAEDFRTFDTHHNIRGLTAGKEIIIVMPDGGPAGWYSDPVSINPIFGLRNWETFHINELIPWIDATFNTLPHNANCKGRAVAGFSMGGFGALKYMAKYPGLFASVSAHSGPASLRRDFGVVANWANTTSAVLELGGGTVYGAPWDDTRITHDNPIENLSSYRDKRIFLVSGDSVEKFNPFSQLNELAVRAGQQEFEHKLQQAGIGCSFRPESGGHFFRTDVFTDDLEEIIEYLDPAT
jgi:S-formylglutathione hydrolase FrmB